MCSSFAAARLCARALVARICMAVALHLWPAPFSLVVAARALGTVARRTALDCALDVRARSSIAVPLRPTPERPAPHACVDARLAH